MSTQNQDYPRYAAIHLFVSELILIVGEGKNVDIETICAEIEAGTIVEYIYDTFGFKNSNSSIMRFMSINEIMKKYMFPVMKFQKDYLIQMVFCI